MITLRAKEELIKTESFGSQKYDADNFVMHRKFRYIEKFRYDSEISLSKEELIKTESFGSQKYDADNFAMHRKFLYIAKFRYKRN